MKKHLLFLMSMTASILCHGQYDAIWPFGYDKPLIHRNFGVSYLDFRGEKVECKVLYEDKSFSLEADGSFICDINNNLALVTNNCVIADKDFKTIIGGDTITPGIHFDSYCGENQSYTASYSSIFFPELSNDSVYYMLHKDKESVPDRGIVLAYHLYLEIIVRRKDGIYYVKEKKLLLEGEFKANDITVVMDKKERKWWTCLPEYDNGTFHSFLIGGEQIVEKNSAQTIGDDINGRDVEGQWIFSPNGKMMAVNSNKYGVMLYDFNNETGLLSNYRTIQYPLMDGEAGLMFSPNSRFLYIIGGDRITKVLYQLDLAQDNEIIKIAEHRSVDEGGWPVSMGWMFIGPDCRIYIGPRSTTYYLHVIHYPNRKGLACTFEPKAIRTPTRVGFDLPNMPMYRFNGQCDSTIGWGILNAVIDPPVQEPFIELFPNPAQEGLHLRWREGFNFVNEMQIHLYNTVGTEVKSIEILNKNMMIDLQGVSEGIYLYIIQKEGHLMQKGKIVVKR